MRLTPTPLSVFPLAPALDGIFSAHSSKIRLHNRLFVKLIYCFNLAGFIERFSPECRKLFVFALVLHYLRLVIGLKISRHFLSQSEVKPKPTVTCSRTFCRASYRLRVLSSSFDWLTGWPVSFVTGQSNYFGFGFTTLN